MDFIELKKEFESAILFKDFNLALKIIPELEAVVKGEVSIPEGVDRKVVGLMLSQLKWVAFVNIEDIDCEDLIKDSLDSAFLIPDFSLEEVVGRRTNLIFLDKDRALFMENLQKALEASVMRLGKENIVTNNKLVEPTVGNWIRDFLAYPSQNALRTNLEEVKYINQNPNTRKLSEHERQELVEILKIYDLLRNSVVDFKSLPVTEDINKAFEGFNLYKMLPGLDYGQNNGEAIFAKPAVAPAAVQRNIVSPPVQRNFSADFPKLKKVEIPAVLAQPPAVPKKPAGANLMDIKAEIESKKRKAQEEIDKKLEELKRKVQK